MKNLDIAVASKRDCDVIQKLESSVRGKYYSTGITKEDIIKYIGTESILLAYYNKEIVGKVSFFYDKNALIISGLIVLPKWRGYGFGEYLTKYVINLHKQIKVFKLSVHPMNNHAIDIYQKIGFKKIRTVNNMYGDGEPRIIMSLVKK